MRIPKDLVPQKVVAVDLCVSLVTLWRARNSAIPDFPKPVNIKNMVFWRKADLGRLEDALLQFRGRSEFEKQRKADKAAAARRRVRRALARRRPSPKQPAQVDLFEAVMRVEAED
jgi:predicted DNA-binding transcriptional regulator AlpA